MSDRIVHQLLPELQPEEGAQTRRFSQYESHSNLVLLGDPGAGKTHLFNEASAAAGGVFVTTRDFLNIPKFADGPTLFIDALDEKRAGRGDQDTIDAVIHKLFEVRPSKVRISCRVADWLGDTDLAAFNAYFDRHGGVTVLSLRSLVREEQVAILELQGVAEPESFLHEAEVRGMEDLLGNPQNLLLLYKVVSSGQWPSSRTELFELATRILLSEENRARSRFGIGVYSPDDLGLAAGAICAARLIADVDGICLAEQDDGPQRPSYRSIRGLDLQIVGAALGRRAFEAIPSSECVDYAHRTIAEFLGAKWLAQQVRLGLPLGRIQALIGVEGHPASELRGLHAWLTVALPEHATTLIDADPYGVLTYGDASSLTPSSRRRLLDALARLSDMDPWFRAGSHSSPAIAALSRPDMVDSFRSILRSREASRDLKSMVLDALAAGPPLIALRDDLVAVLWEERSRYPERQAALEALLRMGNEARALVADTYRQHTEISAYSLQLRSAILVALYEEHFEPSDVVDLVRGALDCLEDLPGGTFWRLPAAMPAADIPGILSEFEPIERSARDSHRRRNVWEVAAFYERLLLRLLSEPSFDPTPEQTIRWLSVRHAFRDRYTGSTPNKLVVELTRRPSLLRSMIDSFLSTLDVSDGADWSFWEFRRASLGALDIGLLLDVVLDRLRVAMSGSREEEFLCRVAFGLSYEQGYGPVFETLYDLVESRPHLAEARRRSTCCELPSLETGYRQQAAAAEAEERAGRQATVDRYLQNLAAVRAGSHLGWLSWAANVYFGFFNDIDNSRPRVERLVELVGQVGATAAIEGFIATLSRGDVHSLDQIVRLASDQRYYKWWYALVAGLDESWQQAATLEPYSESLLESILAIDLLHPTDADESAGHEERGWKIEIFKERLRLARTVYVAIARAMLRRGSTHVPGLYALMNDASFTPCRGEVALQLLSEFPCASLIHLEALLRRALEADEAREPILILARRVLSGDALGDEQRDWWLAAAYLLSPAEFATELDTRMEVRTSIAWVLRDLLGYDRDLDGRKAPHVEVGQLEFVTRIVGRAFPPASHPSGAWSGDTNPWDAAQFVRGLIDRLSSDPSAAATDALDRLGRDDALSTYRNHLLHAVHSQRTRRREAEYQQPSWQQVVSTLSNGRPANVQDLHAILVAQLNDINRRVAAENTDIYKRFWNEDSYGRVVAPKPEESCRDFLIDMLRPSLEPLGVAIEPEAHMFGDQRADISASLLGQKILAELKRHYHSDVWTAIEGQLDRYTRDPSSTGYGVYVVFWFGGRAAPVPPPPEALARPTSAAQMQEMLLTRLLDSERGRIAIVVLDVSGARDQARTSQA